MSEATTRLAVDGMSCGKCSARVTKALVAVNGVSSADVSHESGVATVTHDASVLRHQLEAAVANAGYAVSNAEDGGQAR